jgi:hypothetical protein
MADLPHAGVHPLDGVGTDPATGAAPAADAASALRCARLTGVLGVVFAGLFTAAVFLLHRSPQLGASDAAYDQFYAAGGKTIFVTVALYLVPFAGIAFLWHMTTMRLLVRLRTPRPSAVPFGLQVLAGGLFVGLLFAGCAAAGAVSLLADLTTAPLPPPDVGRALSVVGYGTVFVYAVRVAGMYAITTTTLLLRAGLMPRWLAVVSYVMAGLMLVSTTFNPAVVLVFPGWVLVVGLIVLARAGRSGAGQSGKGATG